jgi:hypothetical protein
MNTTETLEHLFSYGSLQIEAVQLATFGRKMMGEPDTLPGYRETMLEIQDPGVVAISGTRHHRNVQYTGRDSDFVVGTKFKVAKQELEQADVYEAAAEYKRVSVQLKSGTRAWVYVSAASDAIHGNP